MIHILHNSCLLAPGSHDAYELGDLSGKHGLLSGLASVTAAVTDHFLPLWGPNSVMSRSIVIHRVLRQMDVVYLFHSIKLK